MNNNNKNSLESTYLIISWTNTYWILGIFQIAYELLGI